MTHFAGAIKWRGTRVRSLVKDQRGVTGLETAIILIAFVVVASVFAFTVLSTGIFSAERGKETLFAGLKEAQGSLGMQGSVVANGTTEKTISVGDSAWYEQSYITTADSAWSALANVTATADTGDKQEGTASADIAIAGAFTTSLATYETLASALDLSTSSAIRLWVKASSTTSSNDLELVLDDSIDCASSLENIGLPALVAGVWTLASVAITFNEDMTAIQCVGLSVATDLGANTVNLDQILRSGTTTPETADKKEGTASVKVLIGAGFSTGLVAYENLASTLDLTSNDSIEFSIKSSIDLSAGDLALALDNTSQCTSPEETIDLPLLTANTWTRATISTTTNTNLSAVKCVGLYVGADKGAATINLDDISAPGQITSLEFVVTNGVGGEAVDLRAPSDSDANGISDTDSKNTMVLTYTDKNQVVADIYWTKDFIGDNDGDDLLEIGEKAKLTVNLSALANSNPLVKDLTFTVEAKPSEGSVMVVQRTMPSQIDLVNNLK